MYKNTLLLPLLFLLFSCSPKKQNVSKVIVPTDFKVIPFHFSDSQVVNVSNFADKIDYLQLRTSEDDIVGTIDKLILLKGQIFILDKKISKALFVFDTLGHLSYKLQIYDAKNSPRELRDFSISPTQNVIYLYEPNKSQIYKYSLDRGVLLGKINTIEGNFDYFAATSDKLLFIRDSRVGYDVLNDLRLCTFDLEGNFKEGWLQGSFFRNFSFGMENYDPITTSFTKNGNDIYITRQFYDTVYYFDDAKRQLTVKYKIDAGDSQRKRWNELSSTATENQFIEQYSNYGDLFSLAGKFFDTDRYLIFTFLRGDTFGYYIQDKNSSKTYTCRYIVNDIDNIPISAFHYLNDNEIVFQINKEITTERYKSIGNREKPINAYPKLTQLVSNFKENKNPIIAIGRLNPNR